MPKSRINEALVKFFVTIAMYAYIILSFVSNDLRPFIVMSLSNFGEFIINGVIMTPSITSHPITLSHLFLAINFPSLYNSFAKTFPPISLIYIA